MLHKSLELHVKNLRDNPTPHPKDTTYEKRRNGYNAQAEAIRGDVASVEAVVDVLLDLGDRTLEARHFVPHGDESKALVLYFHGGSFVIGNLETHDALCRRLSADTKMRFMAIDYRLAPEHPFPAGINDAVDVFRYVVKTFEKFADKNAKLIVMGDRAADLDACEGLEGRFQATLKVKSLFECNCFVTSCACLRAWTLLNKVQSSVSLDITFSCHCRCECVCACDHACTLSKYRIQRVTHTHTHG
jgi:acetyl esterase